ncbi:hypothetical protein LJC27_08480 [Christensenellaceae bacterium OttesenSCG-928-M15]|nr:hypothetical protein [Christensenellaceae bacterium OttesenSCG-928-M15]
MEKEKQLDRKRVALIAGLSVALVVIIILALLNEGAPLIKWGQKSDVAATVNGTVITVSGTLLYLRWTSARSRKKNFCITCPRHKRTSWCRRRIFL